MNVQHYTRRHISNSWEENQDFPEYHGIVTIVELHLILKKDLTTINIYGNVENVATRIAYLGII